jgi:hypothetical protein
MRKAIGLVVVVVALGVVAAPAAQSDGSCIARAFTPTHPSGNMTYSGEYDCSPTTHTSITLSVSLQRRQVGGLWNLISSNTGTEGPTTRNFTGVITGIAYDCRKDYRTHVSGDASPGGHHNTANSLPILTHTC